MPANNKEATNDSDAVDAGEACYFCGRTPHDIFDLLGLQSVIEVAVDGAIAHISETESKLQQRLTEQQSIREAATQVSTESRALKVSTIESELRTFEQMIPRVKDILTYYKRRIKPGGHVAGQNQTLGGVIAAIQEQEGYDVALLRRNLEEARRYKDRGIEEIVPFQRRTAEASTNAGFTRDGRGRLSAKTRSITVNLALCPICSDLFSQTVKEAVRRVSGAWW